MLSPVAWLLEPDEPVSWTVLGTFSSTLWGSFSLVVEMVSLYCMCVFVREGKGGFDVKEGEGGIGYSLGFLWDD